MNLQDNRVALCFAKNSTYPNELPFDPPLAFPEYRGNSLNSKNEIYSCIREILHQLRMDEEHFNAKEWNPFGEIISPGMTVFIKPNTVIHYHAQKKDIFSLIIHPSVLRPILDYVCIALKGQGKIIIGDSQLIFSSFDKAYEVSGIRKLVDWYRQQTSIPIECFDLRTERGVRTWLYGKWGRKTVKQDPRGYRFVDLGEVSYFKDIDPKKLRIAIASYKNMYKHHSGGKHEYLFPGSLLQSDVVISIPKMKTHRRTAITLALKNFMGIASLKDSLPHFQIGSAEEGGDQYIYPSIRKRIGTKLHDQIQSSPFIPVKLFFAIIKKLIWKSQKLVPFKDGNIQEAMWWGNDTVWRTLLDLNRAVFYADKSGQISNKQQRNFFCLLDGVIAGEGDGPTTNDPVQTGTLLGGFNPVAIDVVATTLMGFDINKIPLILNGLRDTKADISLFWGTTDSIQVIENNIPKNFSAFNNKRYFKFKPHPSWKGHVEI
jgi:uncharacterized protein (DUF362 family)